MRDDLNMTCDNIRETLKQFLDDRLVEKEYRAFLLHLENCSKCEEYVRAVGSLSNQLWKLGEVDVPSDLSSNIIFKLRHFEEDTPQSSLMLSKKMILRVIILIVGVFVFLGGIKFFKTPQPSFKTDHAGIVEAPNIKEQELLHNDKRSSVARIIEEQKPVSDEKAEYLFGQLQTIIESLEPPQKNKVDEKISEKTISKEEDSPSLESPEPDQAPIPDFFSLHWHMPYSKEGEMNQLVETIRILAIDPDYEDQHFLVFKATGEKLKLLSDGIRFANKLRVDLPEFVTDGSFPEREIPVSIFFIKGGSFISAAPILSSDRTGGTLVSLEQETPANEYALDWHVLLLPSKRDTLLNVIHQGGGTINYTSKGAIIFSVYGANIRKLIEQIQSTGGIFVDFGKMALNDGVLQRQIVNVLVTISEK